MRSGRLSRFEFRPFLLVLDADTALECSRKTKLKLEGMPLPHDAIAVANLVSVIIESRFKPRLAERVIVLALEFDFARLGVE